MSTQGLLRHIHTCTQHNLDLFVPFYIGERPVGWVRRELALVLGPLDDFTVTPEAIVLAPDPMIPVVCTQGLIEASRAISSHYKLDLDGEIYPVIQGWGDEPLARIDRLAIPWFGVRGFGVHVNGYVRKADGLHLWIAERALDRRVDPGKLDNMIGGGLPIGLTIEENLKKEAWEEAGFDPSVIASAEHAATLRYKTERMKGLCDGTLFVFDIELPDDVVPRNTDGEVASFTLMPAAEVLQIINDTDRFKFNCNLVLIDFFLRHGFITPEHAEYATLVEALTPLKSQEGMTCA